MFSRVVEERTMHQTVCVQRIHIDFEKSVLTWQESDIRMPVGIYSDIHRWSTRLNQLEFNNHDRESDLAGSIFYPDQYPFSLMAVASPQVVFWAPCVVIRSDGVCVALEPDASYPYHHRFNAMALKPLEESIQWVKVAEGALA